MPASEIFYLHLHGEQRGPYTVPQIDHLLNSGLIGEETLYWCEGLDQWAPVTSLVPKRETKRSWRKLVVTALVLVAFAVPALFFGPVVVDGWREVNQRDYSAQAAYWRARDLVRNQVLPKGAPVHFAPFAAEAAVLQPPGGATVDLQAEIIDSGGKVRSAAWVVHLQFDSQQAEWSGLRPVEIVSQ